VLRAAQFSKCGQKSQLVGAQIAPRTELSVQKERRGIGSNHIGLESPTPTFQLHANLFDLRGKKRERKKTERERERERERKREREI
jgi:hypothetical protein